MFLIILFSTIVAFVWYWKWNGGYWKRRNIDGPNSLPVAGNMLKYMLMQKHYGEVYDEIYRSYPEAAYVGVYKLMNQPSILIRDLDLIKDVMVKHFAYFQDNDFVVDEQVDPLFSKDPFCATGEIWKNGRIHLAPLFTASKIKGIFPLIGEVCKKFIKYIEANPINLEAKKLCSNYTLEVVASIGFGIEAETFTDPNSDFKRMSDKLFVPDKLSLLKTTTFLFLPFLSKLFQLPFIPKEIDLWVRRIIGEVVNQRNRSQEKRNDFLQSLLETRAKTNLSDDLLYGYSITILVEGFETSSTLMAYCLYELALNQHIQDLAIEEVDRIFENNNQQLTDGGVNEMEYLDGIMYETLRLYAPMLALTKQCTKRFEMPPQYANSNHTVTIEPGTPILIPAYAIHHDENHFPEPNKFDPTRFIGENRKNIKKYSFLAFGEGPRMCIGQRFGLVQSKAGIASILKNFRVQLMPKTTQPLPISKTSFVLACEQGIWISFEKR